MKTKIAFAMTSVYADPNCGYEAHGFQDTLFVEEVNDQLVFSTVSLTPYEENYEIGMETVHDRSVVQCLQTPVVTSYHDSVVVGMTIEQAIAAYAKMVGLPYTL